MRGRPRPADLWLWALGLSAYVLLAVYFAQGRGRLDFADHARGRDFVNVWTAGRLLRAGRTAEIFDPPAFMAAAHRWFDPRLPFHFWSYPPPALFLAAPFAAFSGYFSALIAWTATGLLVLAPAVRAMLRRPGPEGAPALPAFALGLVLLSPATATDIGLGQNGAFTAALLLGGLAMLDARPWAAGAVLGLLVFKPQLALLLPLVVLAGGRWRTAAAAAATATGGVLASAAVFGLESWRAFAAHTLPMQAQMLRHGSGPFLWMMPSTFTSARLLGVEAGPALLLQLPVSAVGAWLAWRAYRTPRAAPLARAVVLLTATFLATPQSFNYDLIPTAVAALCLWAWSPRLGDRALALALWALPLAMIQLGRERLPLAPLVLLAAALRLAVVGGVGLRGEGAPYRSSRASKASTAGEAASNT